MSKNPVGVSIIIPVYNEKDNLLVSLAAVKNSDYSNYELIVVDDNSDDGSWEISRRYADSVIKAKVRSGPAKARNQGANKSNGDILMFIDADVCIYSDSISKVVGEMNTNQEISALFGSYDDIPPEKDFFSSYKNLFHHFVHQNSNLEAKTFWAGCGAVRRDAFFESGGFPEKYSTASIEDVEFGYSLSKRGGKIKVFKELKVTHLKKWNFTGLVKTDIMNRAIPWTKLSVNYGLPRDLNFKLSDRFSGIICFILLPLSALIGYYWLAVPLCLLMLSLNRKLYVFFLKKRGIGFAFFAILFHWFYLFYSSAVYAFTRASLFLKSITIRKKNEKTSC